MAAIDFPTATSNGQTFEADSGVIYTYVGTPPNGFWSGTFGTTGLTTLDGRYIAKNDSNTIQTIQTQGLKFNSGSADTILIDGLNSRIGIGTTTTSGASTYYDDLVINNTASGTGSGITLLANATDGLSGIDFGDTDAIGRGRISYSHAVDNLIIDVAGTEAARIDNSGNIGIGTTSPGKLLEIGTSGAVENTNYMVRINRGVTGEYADLSADNGFATIDGINGAGGGVRFLGDGNERARIDTSGRLLVGTTTSASTGNGYTPGLQVAAQSGSISASSYRSDEYGGIVALQKSKSATVGTQALVSNNDQLGLLSFEGSDGTNFEVAAQIQAYVDGTPGTNDMPGRLVFSTTADGASSPTERMRIDNNGKLVVTDVGSTAFLSAANSFAQAMISSNVGGLIINSTDTTASSYCRLIFTANGNLAGNEGLIRYNTNDFHMSFWTQGNERMRIDSSGNVGIGNASPTAKLQVESTSDQLKLTYPSVASYIHEVDSSGNYAIAKDSSERLRLDSSGNLELKNGNQIRAYRADNTRFGSLYTNGFATILEASQSPGDPLRLSSPDRIEFYTNSGEVMRLNSDGQLLHGRTSPYHSGAGSEMLALQGDRNGMVIFNTANLNYYLLTMRHQYANNSNNGLAGTYLIFQDQGGTVRGSIAVGTSTAYNTTSDYRQKENIVNLTGAIDRVKDLSPKRFNWIGRPSSEQIDGFIAHEAQAVVPQAVTGTKDEVDDDGNAVMQGIDQSKLVPLLTAALQEAIAKIETLELPNKNPINISQTTALLNNPFITFLNSSGDTAGSIIQNGVNSVTYATSSDYRLKDNVVELTAAIPRLKQLAPKRFNFTAAADVTVDGFLAHEAQAVVPEAVTGSHNQIDGDGNPVMQGIDQSKLVPLLTAALQEAIGRIETLEAKVATLEGS